MRFTQAQVDEYAETGVLFLPELFSAAEVAVLQAGFDAAIEAHAGGVQTGVQIALAPHEKSEMFDLLARHPRLVEPSTQLLGSPVYVHRCKLHGKLPFTKEHVPWHQDYKRWHLTDRMPAPRVLSAAVFIVDVTEFNGPIVLIPGSQKEGMLLRSAPGTLDLELEYRQYDVDTETVGRLIMKYGIVAPKGPAGSAIFFDANMVHTSGPNLTPFHRDIFLIAYNSVENVLLPVEKPREEGLASRTFDPIECVSNDIFLGAG